MTRRLLSAVEEPGLLSLVAAEEAGTRSSPLYAFLDQAAGSFPGWSYQGQPYLSESGKGYGEGWCQMSSVHSQTEDVLGHTWKVSGGLWGVALWGQQGSPRMQSPLLTAGHH